MALIVCPECEKKISSNASSCPGCGNPIKADKNTKKSALKVVRTGGKWEGAGFLLIMAGIIMLFSSQSNFGSSLLIVGFIVFLIGRFK